MRLALCLAMLAAPALAEAPLSATEFEARTTGRTMTYALDGQVWGREQYLPGRREIWAFEGEDCRPGTWNDPLPELICFAYDDRPDDPQCWRFFGTGGRLKAQLAAEPEAGVLSAVEETKVPLGCPGPDVGV